MQEKRKRVQTLIETPPALKEDFRAATRRQGCTVSEVIRRFMRQYVKVHGGKSEHESFDRYIE